MVSAPKAQPASLREALRAGGTGLHCAFGLSRHILSERTPFDRRKFSR
jgi:hypothetical protein